MNYIHCFMSAGMEWGDLWNDSNRRISLLMHPERATLPEKQLLLIECLTISSGTPVGDGAVTAPSAMRIPVSI